MLRQLLLILLLAASGRTALAQSADTLDLSAGARFRQHIDRVSPNRSYRLLYIGAPLIGVGVAMMPFDGDFHRMRNGFAPSFRHSYDDWLQYAPAAAMLGLKAAGVKSRSSWGRMLVSDAFSTGLMAIAVNSLKYTCNVRRPDGSQRNSFPSGHTATAFMTATMLHKEYGHRSPWYSIGGYAAATVTGITRQLNNRHWMSDVMVGAGIGILATEFGYYLADLIFKEKGLFASDSHIVYDRYRKPSFLAFSVGTTVALGRYTPYPGMQARLCAGPTVGVQGAWFASTHWGVGGRVSSSNLRLEVNNVAEQDDLEVISLYAGPYFSYPLSSRWQFGTKLAAGYELYRACDTHVRRIEERDGFSFGTGISASYLARQHLSIRFGADYDCAPPLGASRQRLHKLTFSLEIAAAL